MYDIISRERAGLKEPRKRTAINESYIKGLTVHYTGAARSPSMKNIDDVFKYLKNIQTDHMVGRGWDDIGYSFAISNQSDEIIELRGFGVYSAHSGKSQINKTFISVVWLGGVNDTPNDNAKDALDDKNGEKYIFIDTILINKNLNIVLKDNAGGIKSEVIDRVFEPYFTTKHQSQGTGIGLYMVEEMVKKHMNGHIEVKNKKYKYKDNDYTGALFTITLPLS